MRTTKNNSKYNNCTLEYIWQAGIFPVPEGAAAMKNRLAFSSYEPKNFKVEWLTRVLVDTNADHLSSSLVVPLLPTKAFSHSRCIQELFHPKVT